MQLNYHIANIYFVWLCGRHIKAALDRYSNVIIIRVRHLRHRYCIKRYNVSNQIEIVVGIIVSISTPQYLLSNFNFELTVLS